MTRTFIALELNSNLQRQLEEAIRQLAQVLPNVRRVDPTGIHLTLARIKAPLTSTEQQQLQRILVGKQQGIVSPAVYAVQHLAVMKSELLRTGARYTYLQKCLLGGIWPA